MSEIINESLSLQAYAKATGQRILVSQSELPQGDELEGSLFTWCQQQGDVVVLQSGLILTSNPSSRTIQNCKSLMASRGLRPKGVVPITADLLQLLLTQQNIAQAAEAGANTEQFSHQQQRLRSLIQDALSAQASDIHIEVRETIARVKFRRHGELQLVAEWVPQLARELAAVAFNTETDHAATHFNPLTPQSAAMPFEVDGAQLRMRLASVPAHGGYDLVIRLLSIGEIHQQSLKELGYTEEQECILESAMQQPHGLVLLSGPTGSGKTTTLASCLGLIQEGRKIYTIEDPVEKLVPGATQIPITLEHDNRGFATMGKAALRMDPDVIVLGEARDHDTANVMLRAALTGHLVLSTVHSSSAMSIVTRLRDLGVSRYLLSERNMLVCLASQRLVPKLCRACALPFVASYQYQQFKLTWNKRLLQYAGSMRVRNPNGCAKCQEQGIDGRTVVAELIWVDDMARECIQLGDQLRWQQALYEQRWRSMAEQAAELAKAGVCDPTDLIRIVGAL